MRQLQRETRKSNTAAVQSLDLSKSEVGDPLRSDYLAEIGTIYKDRDILCQRMGTLGRQELQERCPGTEIGNRWAMS